jgi:hypothetical protein
MSASRLSTVDMAAYMINCIYLIQSTLALYQFTDTRLEMLQAQVIMITITFIVSNRTVHYTVG